MQYKIVNLRVKNFKCFDNTQFYEFCFDYDKNPIILSGPNGFGKTTFFDAIELIFSKDITRLDKGIEKKTTNLGKNILLNKLTSARNALRNAKNEYDEYGTACPFCNTKFANTILLDAGFEEVEQILQIESGSVGKLIAQKRQELKIAVEEVKKIIHSYVDGLNEVSIDLLIQRKTSLKGFISDAGRVANVENLIRYLADAEFETKKIESNNLVVEIQRVLSELVKNIENAEFDNLYAKYDYEKIDKIYGNDIENMMKQMTVATLDRKLKYLEMAAWEKENTEIYEIKQEMKALIIRQKKIEKIRHRLNELSKVYENAIELYKNSTLKQLRVPLLIYTGKILQDYQNGLGVFVSKDEMRFLMNLYLIKEKVKVGSF